MSRAQVSFEFFIIIGFLLSAFVVFFLIIQDNMSEKINKRIDLELLEIAKTIRTEIDLASSSSDGYFRKFSIPKEIYSGAYKVNLTSEFIFVSTLDNEHIISLPVKNNSGQILFGENTIKKENGQVKLNQ